MIKRKKKTPEEIQKGKDHLERRNQFFMNIWSKRKHNCASCSIFLGYEAKSYMFDHLLEKNKRKDLEFEEKNIFLCCFTCHEKKTNGFPTEIHQEAINKAEEQFKLNQ